MAARSSKRRVKDQRRRPLDLGFPRRRVLRRPSGKRSVRHHVRRAPRGGDDLRIYSARLTDITRRIEYVGPTFWNVPITRHLSPSEHALSKLCPDAVRSIVQK